MTGLYRSFVGSSQQPASSTAASAESTDAAGTAKATISKPAQEASSGVAPKPTSAVQWGAASTLFVPIKRRPQPAAAAKGRPSATTKPKPASATATANGSGQASTAASAPTIVYAAAATPPTTTAPTTAAASAVNGPAATRGFVSTFVTSSTATPSTSTAATKKPIDVPSAPPSGQEYDPSRPNDFVYWKTEIERRKREARQRLLDEAMAGLKKAAASSKEAATAANVQSQEQQQPLKTFAAPAFKRVTEPAASSSVASSSVAASSSSLASSAAAPAQSAQTLDMSGEEAYLRRLRMSGATAPALSAQANAVARTPAPTSLPAKQDDPMEEYETRLVLLTNVVGPGDVDDELEGEIREECSKFGRVRACRVVEIKPRGRVPDEEAVQVYVEFDSLESAIQAQEHLNRRFFGGRTVAATFVPLDRFPKA
ncbi:hypothetical protein BC831DRAFT_470270 [Entophlyctis helioformis]|nr:hypothetical protein BC831DRAFT_470270 [Entophlyctis helioformis]